MAERYNVSVCYRFESVSNMKTAKIFLLCFLAILFHSTVMKLFAIGPFRPDLSLLVLVYLSLREGSFAGVWIGFFIGLLQDAYRPSSFGVNAFAKSLAGYMIGFFNEREWKIDIWVRSIILFLTFFLHDIVAYAIRHGGFEGALQNSFYYTLPSFLYTLAIWATIWLFFRRKGQIE